MASTAAILSILVEANASKARVELAALNRDLTKSEAKAKNLRIAAAATGLALGGGLALGARAGWKELQEAQRAAAQTNAVLKSTGGVANVTAKHVDDLAQKLLKKSGADDEAVKSGENMLLTFTQIRNEAGKGNKIFDRATQAIADMATAMNGGATPSAEDLRKTAIQVGKALQDPIKGATALRRVGVALTESQQAQIKTFIKNGEQMKAQKLILTELNREFGGSAAAAGKTLPGQLNILRETFKNLAASIVQAAVPAMQALIGPMQTVANFMTQHTTFAKVLTGVIAGLAAVLITVSVAEKVYAAGAKIAAAAQWAWNAAMSANPILLMVAALAALGVAIVVAYRKIKPFREAVQATWSWIKDHWPLLLGILTGPIGLAVVAIVRNWGKLRSATSSAFGAVRDTISGALHDALSVVRGIAGAFGSAGHAIGAAVANGIKGAGRGLVAAVRAIINAAIDVFNTGISAINSVTPGKVKVLGHTVFPGIPDIPTVPHVATGAFISGPKGAGDIVPLWTKPGEVILNERQQAMIGKRRIYDVLSATGAQTVGPGGKAARGGLTAMQSAASRINSRHYPYLWGGGHNPSFSPPYDCSGAVSAVLHAGGVLSSPLVSGQLANWGDPGPGTVTIYANPVHTWMRIAGRAFGTSRSNPGGGAGWFGGNSSAGYSVRHVPEKLLRLNRTGGMLADGTDKGVRPGRARRKSHLVASKGGNLGGIPAQGTFGTSGLPGGIVSSGSFTPTPGAPSFTGDFSGGDSGSGGDPNQPLIDALNADAQAQIAAAQALADLRAEVKRQNDFATSVANVTSIQAVRALADVISGQIVAVGLNSRANTASAGSVVRY